MASITERVELPGIECDNPLIIVRTLELVLEATFVDLPTPPRKGKYFIAGAERNIHGVEAADVDESIHRLSEPLRVVKVGYATGYNAPAAFKAEIWSHRLRRSISTHIDLDGPNTNETVGWIEHVKTRTRNEVTQRNSRGWEMPVPAGASNVESAPISVKLVPPPREGLVTRMTSGARKWVLATIGAVATAVVVAYVTGLLPGQDSPEESVTTPSQLEDAPPSVTAPAGEVP